ncbi:MAG: sulfite exporter TauE/SafE family protein [Actinomycetia bacterium]|nr:sulfite exporter TauE/SafE family protein [Actinomycetes bacterium]MCP4962935.1 sulfite exporter TauE/SafE family protein [Actinomycetes bacterium]
MSPAPLERSQIDGFLVSSAQRHNTRTARRQAVALTIPAGIVLIWATATTLTGSWPVVADGLTAAITMVAGSLVAGSTPQGGGAVAFPVLTKGLDVSVADARTFSLCIQAVGMGSATLTMVALRRRIEWRALTRVIPASMVGFATGLTLEALSPLSDAWVKVGFTGLVAFMAMGMVVGRRLPVRESYISAGLGPIPLVAIGYIGGVAAALVGSGTDVVLYLGMVVAAGLSPRIGVATSVAAMAALSTVGLLTLGLVGGSLFDTSTPSSVGTMWLAAVPVVAIGAPVGAWIAHRIAESTLICIIAAMAAVEAISTFVLVEQLRTNSLLLIAAAVAAMAIIIVGPSASRSARRRLRCRSAGLDRALTRGELTLHGLTS